MNPVVLLLVAVSCCMAAGGGMGGGALLVPIFLVVAQLEARTAIGLSNVTICCGALASFLINIQRRHPHKRAPLIDWSMVLMLEPLTVLGALVGGYVNKVRVGGGSVQGVLWYPFGGFIFSQEQVRICSSYHQSPTGATPMANHAVVGGIAPGTDRRGCTESTSTAACRTCTPSINTPTQHWYVTCGGGCDVVVGVMWWWV